MIEFQIMEHIKRFSFLFHFISRLIFFTEIQGLELNNEDQTMDRSTDFTFKVFDPWS